MALLMLVPSSLSRKVLEAASRDLISLELLSLN
jgi:hypothetical protein